MRGTLKSKKDKNMVRRIKNSKKVHDSKIDFKCISEQNYKKYMMNTSQEKVPKRLVSNKCMFLITLFTLQKTSKVFKM